MENIPVERLIELQSKIESKQKELDQANQTIGEKEYHIKTLQKEIDDLKSRELKEVHVTSERRDWYGNRIGISEDFVEYRNLDSVKLELQEKIKKEYKDELNLVKTELERIKSLKDSEIEKIRIDHEISKNNNIIYYKNAELKLEEKIDKLENKIKKLQPKSKIKQFILRLLGIII